MAGHGQLVELLQRHLGVQLHDDSVCWQVRDSPLGGRGVFAKQDIRTGQQIFADIPLVLGPRSSADTMQCVRCHATGQFKPCPERCGLPVCYTSCEDMNSHHRECRLIQQHLKQPIDGISSDLFRGLAPFRGLLLDGSAKELLESLAAHAGRQHGYEVELLNKHLNLNVEQQNYLKTVCSVLDANAFETIVETDGKQSSQRGLYPLSSLMNHCCVPNMTHTFNSKCQMIVSASKPIRADEEIFTSYTKTFWATATRRQHLLTTKHFLCECKRCQDPTELGTNLSALRCLQPECTGSLLPVASLDFSSKWQCDECDTQFSAKRIGMVQTSLGSLLKRINPSDVKKLLSILRGNLHKVMPLTNQIAVEFKCKAIWLMGYRPGYLWHELSNEDLVFKEELCRDLLDILGKLTMGQCKLKGLLLCELYFCMIEKIKRDANENDINVDWQGKQHEPLLAEAVRILRDDVTAPPEVMRSYRLSGGP